jgi:hypothetical protein
MALAHCILGKFLGVVCHCFPMPLDIPTSATRCLHIPINASTRSSERWNCGREWSGNFAKIVPFLRHLGIFYMLQICDMGQTALLPFCRKACWGFFRPKNYPHITHTKYRPLSEHSYAKPWLQLKENRVSEWLQSYGSNNRGSGPVCL